MNVRKAAHEYNLHPFAEAVFCDNRANELSLLPLVYDAHGVIEYSPAISETPNDLRIWIYVAESAPQRKSIVDRRPDHPAYNLKEGTGDICVKIRAWNMALQGFTSNTVRVPAGLVRDCLVAADEGRLGVPVVATGGASEKLDEARPIVATRPKQAHERESEGTPMGEEFGSVQYMGEVIPLSRTYADFHDYRDDPENIPMAEVPRVASLVKTARIPARFASRGAADDFLYTLMFPGYGFSVLQMGRPVALYSLEIPRMDEDRWIVIVPAGDEWLLIDDFIWKVADGRIASANYDGTVIQYVDPSGKVLRRK